MGGYGADPKGQEGRIRCLTCYIPREYFCYPYKLGEAVGRDFGVETKITLFHAG